jgi:prophage antirepressor-like protein
LKINIDQYPKNEKIRVEDLLQKVKSNEKSAVFISSKKRYSLVMQSNQKQGNY